MCVVKCIQTPCAFGVGAHVHLYFCVRIFVCSCVFEQLSYSLHWSV